jgi:hypothetical protein
MSKAIDKFLEMVNVRKYGGHVRLEWLREILEANEEDHDRLYDVFDDLREQHEALEKRVDDFIQNIKPWVKEWCKEDDRTFANDNVCHCGKKPGDLIWVTDLKDPVCKDCMKPVFAKTVEPPKHDVPLNFSSMRHKPKHDVARENYPPKELVFQGLKPKQEPEDSIRISRKVAEEWVNGMLKKMHPQDMDRIDADMFCVLRQSLSDKKSEE